MLETLEVGYKIEFLETPRFRGVLSSQLPREESRSAILLKEVEDMLLKSAIRPVKGNPHQGFYSRIFLAPKKGGKMEASHKSQTSQSVYQKAKIQNGNPAEHHTGREFGGLAGVNCPQGRLLSCANPSKSLEVSSVRSRQQQVQVHGASVRYYDGPKSVYQDDGPSGVIHQEGDGVVQFTLPR